MVRRGHSDILTDALAPSLMWLQAVVQIATLELNKDCRELQTAVNGIGGMEEWSERLLVLMSHHGRTLNKSTGQGRDPTRHQLRLSRKKHTPLCSPLAAHVPSQERGRLVLGIMIAVCLSQSVSCPRPARLTDVSRSGVCWIVWKGEGMDLSAVFVAEGVCVFLFMRFPENSDCDLGSHPVMHTVQPRDSFEGQARRDTRPVRE